MARGINRAADPVICAGDAAIAVIIYEKVFMFASMDRDFLSRYQFLAMDEIGLTQDVSRGMKADFILVRARMYQNLKVIALATPYYDRSRYLTAYQFLYIREG